MPDIRTARKAFPLRLDEETRETLKVVAKELGTTMSALVVSMVQRELEVLSLSLEGQLSETVALLREYRSPDAKEDWAAFARAEVEEEDPIQTRLLETESADRYGLAEIFA